MFYRKNKPELWELNLRFRELWHQSLGSFSEDSPQNTLAYKEQLLHILTELKVIDTSKQDRDYYSCLHYLVTALFLAIQSFQDTLTGTNAEATEKGVQANISQFLKVSEGLDNSRPSIQRIRKAISAWQNASDIGEILKVVNALNSTALPVILSVQTNRYSGIRDTEAEEMEINENKNNEAEKDPPLVISTRFYIDSELWENPQIVKPGVQYSINGSIKINKWPEGYQLLELKHVSTTDDSWMILSFPFIKYAVQTEFSINGSVVVKYPQSLMDSPHSIRLLARFTAKDKDPIYPTIIGYNQLILRAIDSKNFNFPTGYKKLNEKVADIFIKIKREIPKCPEEEIQNFLILLSSILNYQGYCFQHAEYKKEKSVQESDFRDKLISFLSANPGLASDLIKEGHIAGGRVEINYNGIVAELKVEKQIADRNKVIEAYQQQPLVYASAIGSQLSILCVLDLTEKKFASSTAAKNVFLINAPVHGFAIEQSESRVAVVFIDGNTKNPSSY